MPAGHKNAVLEVHWTPDGEELISCSPDKTVRVWDAETGTEVKRLQEHKDIVNSCCPARRGPPLVVSGGDDCQAKLWDLRARNSVKTFDERYQVGVSVMQSWWAGGVLHGGMSACHAYLNLDLPNLRQALCDAVVAGSPCRY